MESTVSLITPYLTRYTDMNILSVVNGILEKGSFVVAVDKTMESLLRAEDLDGDCLITVDDHGPKVLPLTFAS